MLCLSGLSIGQPCESKPVVTELHLRAFAGLHSGFQSPCDHQMKLSSELMKLHTGVVNNILLASFQLRLLALLLLSGLFFPTKKLPKLHAFNIIVHTEMSLLFVVKFLSCFSSYKFCRRSQNHVFDRFHKAVGLT